MTPKPRHVCPTCSSPWLTFSYHAPRDQLQVTCCACDRVWFIVASKRVVRSGAVPAVAGKDGVQ